MSKPRLSRRQREVLESIEECCRPAPLCNGAEPTVVPASMFQLGVTFGHEFLYERDFERFVENLQERGFVRIERKQFIYITDEGKAAVGAAP